MKQHEIEQNHVARVALKIRPHPWTLLSALAVRQYLSIEQIYTILWPTENEPKESQNIIRVYVTTLRQKLYPYGVGIKNLTKTGYQISFEEQKVMQNLIVSLSPSIISVDVPYSLIYNTFFTAVHRTTGHYIAERRGKRIKYQINTKNCIPRLFFSLSEAEKYFIGTDLCREDYLIQPVKLETIINENN